MWIKRCDKQIQESDFKKELKKGKIEETPEHKRVEPSHVSEVVEFGHVGKHVVEVVGIWRVLTLCPPSNNRFLCFPGNNSSPVWSSHFAVKHCILWLRFIINGVKAGHMLRFIPV